MELRSDPEVQGHGRTGALVSQEPQAKSLIPLGDARQGGEVAGHMARNDGFMQRLIQSLQAERDLRDLCATLEQVEKAVEKQWSKDYQPWFTDHGPGHSRRVAEAAATISVLPKVRDDLRLNPVEAYVLHVAAWLHDVGMQEILGEIVGEIPYGRFDQIRHEHPARTLNALLERPTEFGLINDAALVEAIAFVAQSHGTRYYLPSIEVLKSMHRVRDYPFRGPLLAALLLMADELDLYYVRAPSLPGGGTLSHISEAHNFKHRCIRSATPTISEAGAIGVSIELAFPTDLSTEDQYAVERWITSKLRRQMGLVEPDVLDGLEGQVHFDRAVTTAFVDTHMDRPLPSPRALSVIRAESAREDLLDHRAALKLSVDALDEHMVIIQGRWDADRDLDIDGREDILAAATALWSQEGGTVHHGQRLRLVRGGSCSDVLSEWIASAWPEIAMGAGLTGHEEADRATFLGLLVEQVNSDPTERHLFAASSLDGLGPDSAWLIEQAVPTLVAASGGVRFLFTTSVGAQLSPPGVSVVLVPVDRPKPGELTRDLARYLASSVATAQANAGLDYGQYKLLCQSMELQLLGGDLGA